MQFDMEKKVDPAILASTLADLRALVTFQRAATSRASIILPLRALARRMAITCMEDGGEARLRETSGVAHQSFIDKNRMDKISPVDDLITLSTTIAHRRDRSSNDPQSLTDRRLHTLRASRNHHEPPTLSLHRSSQGTALHLPQSAPVRQRVDLPLFSPLPIDLAIYANPFARLSRPSLVVQHPISATALPSTTSRQPPVPASLAYTTTHPETNPSPFLLSPILNLPPSFGSAYVGDTFSCTLCANHEPPPASADPLLAADAPLPTKIIRDVRIEAEMKTPSSGAALTKLELTPPNPPSRPSDPDDSGTGTGVDLDPGQTLQRIVNFHLKDEGNHVLGVTVSYYEATETSGRTRTFRKLYQFICKPSLIVRTKASMLPSVPAPSLPSPPPEKEEEGGQEKQKRRRWVFEAQLENCSEDTIELETVRLELETGLSQRDCNWEASGSPRPVVHPGEVEQVCFVIEEESIASAQEEDGRITFGVLGIGWRGEMGSKGYLGTGKLGTKHVG